MCGIVGLFLKDPALHDRLGSYFAPMLMEMRDRGPDSAGFAIYRDDAPPGTTKLTLFHADTAYPWQRPASDLAEETGQDAAIQQVATHAVLSSGAPAESLRDWLAHNHPKVRVVGIGEAVEIFKEKGNPADIIARFGLAEMKGSHALGHTRMATESAVTTEHSHPFSTGLDLCLVHNGSLSNHNRLRQWLRRHGTAFETDNDSEVAAGYLTYRMGEGMSLDEALEAAVKDLDGFYTFAVSTKSGFAVLRDPIACKPAVLAETDAWVAMSSEYQAIGILADAEGATIWEPRPGVVYHWELS
ncbi:MAG: class II glutamine amidotransferase [Geminicoccales bacterium]